MTYRRRRGLGGRKPPRGKGSPHGGELQSGRRASGPASGSDVEARGGAVARSGVSARWLVTGGLVLLFFGAGYLAAAGWLRPEEEGAVGALVEVPELVGLTAEEAQGRLEKMGLEYVLRSGISHPEAPEGAVLAQSPLPGQYARPGAPVYVTLSLGPERHVVPDVAGMTERQASIVLERLGFTVHVERRVHAFDRGRSVETVPEAGSRLSVPAEITLVVSEGPPAVHVPVLVGRHIDDAERLLAEAGLQMGPITYDPDATEAPGRITGQYPPAGYSLREGGRVEVRVAGDPASVRRLRWEGTSAPEEPRGEE